MNDCHRVRGKCFCIGLRRDFAGTYGLNDSPLEQGFDRTPSDGEFFRVLNHHAISSSLLAQSDAESYRSLREELVLDPARNAEPKRAGEPPALLEPLVEPVRARIKEVGRAVRRPSTEGSDRRVVGARVI